MISRCKQVMAALRVRALSQGCGRFDQYSLNKDFPAPAKCTKKSLQGRKEREGRKRGGRVGKGMRWQLARVACMLSALLGSSPRMPLAGLHRPAARARVAVDQTLMHDFEMIPDLLVSCKHMKKWGRRP